MPADADVATALAAWPCRVESVRPFGRGWNSRTWLAETSGGRFVAKLADHDDAGGLAASLRLAEHAAARGLACGAPVRTSGGDLTAGLPGGVLALLRFEPGRPPDLSAPDQVRRAGRVLARAHRVLSDCPAPEGAQYRWPWEWVAQGLDTIAMPGDVRTAVSTAWQEIVATVDENRLTVSLIHGDPGPEGFLLTGTGHLTGTGQASGANQGGGTGQDALVDWATTMRGPLLYDLASFAVLTRPAAPAAARWFTEGYAADLPEITAELACLDCLVRARWVAQAIYFCSRIDRGIDRGPGPRPRTPTASPPPCTSSASPNVRDCGRKWLRSQPFPTTVSRSSAAAVILAYETGIVRPGDPDATGPPPVPR